MKANRCFITLYAILLSLVSTATAEITSIPLPDLIGLYNTESVEPVPVSDPILSTLSNIQQIQLHIEGTHAQGEAAYEEMIEEPFYWNDPVGLSISAHLEDFLPDYHFLTGMDNLANGSFDLTNPFVCYADPPIPSWDDFVSDGFLDLNIYIYYETYGNPVPYNVNIDPTLNIKSAELIIEIIPEPATAALLALGALLIRRR